VYIYIFVIYIPENIHVLLQLDRLLYSRLFN